MRPWRLLPSLIICLCLSEHPSVAQSRAWAQSEPAPSTSAITSGESPAMISESPAPIPNISQRLPIGDLYIDDQVAAIPDWRVVSFDAFPVFASAGQWGDVEWLKGDRLADVLTLGDFQGTLDLHLLTLASITEGVGIPTQFGKKSPLYQIKLSEFRLLERQTIASLAEAVPSLLEMPIKKLEILQDLVKSVQPTFVAESSTLEELLKAHPDFGEIKLSPQILADYTVADLPGVEVVPLQSFAQWEDTAISEVPLLPVMSWWLFPDRPAIDGEIATTTIRSHEDQPIAVLTPYSRRFEPIEWSVAEEVAAVDSIFGTAAEEAVGQEPEGVFPFGPVFKVVPEAITPEAVETAMYFRTCRQVSGQLACSGYGIGPIPLHTYRAGENIFLGEGALPLAPVKPPEPVPQPASPAPPQPAFLEVVVDSATEHKGPISLVIIILVLTGGASWWALKGDPIQFFMLTFCWAITAQRQRHLNCQLAQAVEAKETEATQPQQEEQEEL